MWLWLILVVAVLFILFYSAPSQRENMSNDKLLSTLKTFGEQGTKDPNLSKDVPIMGPVAPAVDPADSLKAASKTSGTTGAAYPKVFGPDVALTPGQTSGQTSGKASAAAAQTPGSGYTLSDVQSKDPNFEFNPDLKKAFPYSGPPQPFLTDFSKIQH